MSDAELLIVLCMAALLIVVTFFSSLRRRRRNRVDYWLPDGTRLKRKADGPYAGPALALKFGSAILAP